MATAFLVPGMARAEHRFSADDVPAGNQLALAGDYQQSGQESSALPPTSAGGDAATPSDQGAGLEEIIVTAQRRSESLQRAAIPIDVVSADEASRALITSPAQLGNLVPSLQTGNGAGTQPIFYLRGVGTFATNPITDAAIAFNFDGVYIAKPNATSGYFYDLARIEVLKGPQGTLYGRNATGGAINVIPQTPEPGSTNGFFTGVYGNYDTVNLQGAVNIATSENSALRISGTYAKHDGYQRDGTSDLDARAIRGQFLIQPDPNLKIRISADYFDRFGRGTAGTIAYKVLNNVFTNTVSVVPTGFSPDVGPSDPLTAQYFRTTFSGQAGRVLDKFDIETKLNGKFWGGLVQIDWTTPIGTLTILPAYRHARIADVWSSGGLLVDDKERQRQTSVEARLTGEAGPLSYLLGGYYFDESVDAKFIALNQTLNAYQFYGTETRSTAGFTRLTYRITDNFRVVGGARYTKDKKAIDGVSDVMLAICRTGFCPGAPLLPSTKDFPSLISQMHLIPVAPGVYIQPGNPAAANMIYVHAPTAQNGRLSDGKLTYRAAVEFDLTPRSLLYASFESGFRSGGFSFSNTYPTYKPETIDAWTIGSKSRFFDNRLQVNLEGYYWKYSNQQLPHQGTEANGQPGFFTQNVGKSTNKGFEIDAKFLPFPNTLLSADIQYLDAKYNSFIYQTPATANPVLSTPGAPVFFPALTSCPYSGPVAGQYTVDCSNRRALSAPKWTVALGIQQTVPLDDNKIVIDLDTRYRSSSIVGFEMLPEQTQKGFWRSNASIVFMTRDDRLSLGAFVNNIENKRTIQVVGYSSPLSSLDFSYSDPRLYGVRMGIRF